MLRRKAANQMNETPKVNTFEIYINEFAIRWSVRIFFTGYFFCKNQANDIKEKQNCKMENDLF